MATWPLAATARNDFADMIEALSTEQLEQPTYCEAWTARGVLAHVTSFPETGIGKFVATMARNRFDFDRVSIDMADTQLARPVAEVLAALRAGAAKSAALPMFPEAMTVTDVAIHTQDVRRPLGLEGSLNDDVLDTALEFLTTHKMATTMVDRKPLEGLRLVATDRSWTFGSGDEISGAAEALLMAMAGRPVLDDLTGEGLTRWR